MSKKAFKKQLLELPEEERAELAHLLIDSLNPKAEFETEEDWSKELRERIERYEQGAGSAKSWSEVKKNAQAQLDK